MTTFTPAQNAVINLMTAARQLEANDQENKQQASTLLEVLNKGIDPINGNVAVTLVELKAAFGEENLKTTIGALLSVMA